MQVHMNTTSNKSIWTNFNNEEQERLIAAFVKRYNPMADNNQCWEWQGSITKSGYGKELITEDLNLQKNKSVK